MQKRVFLMFALITAISSSTYSQAYKQVDKIVESYPQSISYPKDLADLINRDFAFEEDRARAIYMWISSNIVYDVEADSSLQERFFYRSEGRKRAKERKIRIKWAIQCLENGKAECEGYATLYKCFCDLVSLECIIIPGNTKRHEDDIGNPSLEVNHAWNVVKINGEWKFIDVAWGAGYIDYPTNTFYRVFDSVYFLTSPDRYFYTHFPKDTNFLFTNRTTQEFIDLPIYYSEFLRTDFEIIEPKTGLLKIKGNDKVSFKMTSPTGIYKLSYSFDEEPLYDIKIYKEAEYYVFKIQIPKERKNILNLYFKRRGIATFKIENILP